MAVSLCEVKGLLLMATIASEATASLILYQRTNTKISYKDRPIGGSNPNLICLVFLLVLCQKDEGLLPTVYAVA